MFFAEGATLAHVARPLVLARSLDPKDFEVTFARPSAFGWSTLDAPFPCLDLACQDASVFAHRLEQGQPLYDYATLSRYVQDDLALIDAQKPDVIVGDFRLSLAVSARLRSIPYISICDAYWSPERPLRAPLPVLGFTRFTPIPVAEFAFRCVSGLALRIHALPLERLRRRYRLPSLGFDLRRCYTDADLRLFANFPALFPDVRAGSQAAFIGPLAWSPAPSPGFAFLEQADPLIYVTMGSSGDPQVLARLIPILERSGHRIVVASAGKPLPPGLGNENTAIFDYVPGDLVCKRAILVICNGGSPTTNQALSNGVPVLGIARNMDQFLNMETIVRFGAGMMVRADRADEASLAAAAQRLLGEQQYAARAAVLADTLRAESLDAAFAGHLCRMLARRDGAVH